jgi:(p)ppGpp synthase/HD superfamily hydrolase
MSPKGTATKLEQAILFATKAHEGQKDYKGLPYILHPLRVMNRVRRAGGDETAMIVALLHDVLEDTDTRRGSIRAAFGDVVTDSVVALTRGRGVSYELYITFLSQCRNRDLVVMVKLADLAENLARGKETPLPKEKQAELNKRYKAAQKFLMSLPKEEGGTQCS